MLFLGECICLAQSITAFSLQFCCYSWVSSQNSKINRLQIKINRNTAPKLVWMFLCCHLICQETERANPCLKMCCCSPRRLPPPRPLYPVLPSASAQQSQKPEWFGVCLKCENWVELIVGGVGMLWPTNHRLDHSLPSKPLLHCGIAWHYAKHDLASSCNVLA